VKRRWLGFMATAWIASALACNAIVGNEDPVLDDTDASPESGAEGEATDGTAITDSGACPSCDVSTCATCDADARALPLPVLFAGDQLIPTDLAVDSDPNGYVYWTIYQRPGAVLRKRKGDPNAVIEKVYVPTQQAETPMCLALDATHVYWTSNDFYGASGSIHYADLDGGNHHGYFTPGFGSRIEVDSNAMYWLTRGPGQLFRMPLGADASSAVAFFTEPPDGGERGGFDLALESSLTGFIYWADSQTLERIDKTGQNYSTIGPRNPPNAYAGPVALTADSFYFTGATGRVIMRSDHNYQCPGLVACPAVLVDSQYVNMPDRLRVDANYIYWANNGDSRVMRANLDGTDPTVLATAVGGVIGFAMDATDMYWTVQYPTDGGLGSVWRLPR
jgi:hypothetical protein